MNKHDVGVPFWVSAHFHFLDLIRQEKPGDGGGGDGEPRREEMNCVISASMLDPWERRQLEVHHKRWRSGAVQGSR